MNKTIIYIKSFEDEEEKLKAEYREKLLEWRKELVGDAAFIEICKDKIAEHYQEVKEEAEYLDGLYRNYARCKEGDAWLYQLIIQRSKKRKTEYERQLRKWRHELSVSIGTAEHGNLDIDKAKLVPIDLLFGKNGQGTRARKFFSCFLHEDKSPSLCWYVAQNKVHCFSCGFHGDAIDVFMKVYGVDFVAAVKSLHNY